MTFMLYAYLLKCVHSTSRNPCIVHLRILESGFVEASLDETMILVTFWLINTNIATNILPTTHVVLVRTLGLTDTDIKRD